MREKNLITKILPNVSTILVVAVMLIVNRVLAEPSGSPAMQTGEMNQLSYQGTLLDNEGNPVDGYRDITFRIYNHPTDATFLWEEAHTGMNAVPVSSGLFNVLLGSLNPIPDLVWNEGDLYLGVQVGSDTELAPRELINLLPARIAPESLNGNVIAPGTLNRNSLRNYLFYYNSDGIIALRDYQKGGSETTLLPANCQTLDEWCCNSENTICLQKSSTGNGTLAFNISGGGASCWLAHNDDDHAMNSRGIYYATNNGNWPFSSEASVVFFFAREGVSDNPIKLNATYDIYCFN